MSKFIRRRLEDLRLVGGRFEENRGWLDFDVLPELLTMIAISNKLVFGRCCEMVGANFRKGSALDS